ncbi:hypothetical protein L226DRAFT_525062 [Lentinus tigrinus ALCF2SS1-7]|uniref:PWWP domain-containing protein n=1 Tax=Lentinus tigrinus ALCF2SS1-6 TaxID=1328759 RepID=A0A5C2S2G9_9APHY|nr:hypothetical protein L227DRAFT_565185 [Lentinus tigrinus ALCF2SS1-6]RPD71945.1 hypothetical protein L226DRAFT_525062 [Lentinus tigrinus ALCF2SS1-7]
MGAHPWWPGRVCGDGTLPTIDCDVWIAGFGMTRNHLYLLCYSHDLTSEEIESQGVQDAAARILDRWGGDGVDLIPIYTTGDDGRRYEDYLVVLFVAPQVHGREPPIKALQYKPEYADVLPTMFDECYMREEKYFPRRILPWVWMPWPEYRYLTCRAARILEEISRDVSARWRARAAAKKIHSSESSTADGSASSGGDNGKQGTVSGESGSENGAGLGEGGSVGKGETNPQDD